MPLSVEVLSSFLSASVLLALVPGPDNLFVLTQGALYGRRAGWLVTLGLTTGLVVHTAAVAFGVGAVIATSPMAFMVLKVLGATYLLYLAWQLLAVRSQVLSVDGAPQLTGVALYRRGIIMNVSNPKVTMFFLAFLPQFVDPGRGAATVQVMILGVAFMLATLLVFGLIAGFAGYIGEWLRRSPRTQLIMSRVTAGLFVLLALRLLLLE